MNINLPNLDFADGIERWESRGGAALTETYRVAKAPGGKAVVVMTQHPE